MKGDVWEWVLAPTTQTGPAINARDRLRREEMQALFVEFDEVVSLLDRVIWDGSLTRPYPRDCWRPAPDIMAQLIFVSRGVIQTSANSELDMHVKFVNVFRSLSRSVSD